MAGSDRIDEALHQMSFLVEICIVGNGHGSGAVGRDDGNQAGLSDGGSEAVRIISLVRQEVFPFQSLDQILGLDAVMNLARGHDEADRIAQAVDGNVDLAGQAAARAPDGLILSPPLAPAAC